MGSFVTHLESALDGTVFPADRPATTHRDRPLWVRYDLDAVRRAVRPDEFAGRAPSLWRFGELLPLPEGAAPVSLGEGPSPLLEAKRLGAELGLSDFWIKDESQLPTGSFKCRGLTLAVTMARHFGLRRLAIPSAGNAGGALAAYAARAGLEAFIFMPRDTPVVNQLECILAGAQVFLVNGLINDCGAVVRKHRDEMNWFDCSTLREPYRIEGKKTMGLELAEQLDWTLPDVIVYPTGGGTGLIGMWKAFQELKTLGWLKRERLPRMIAVQSDGCAPIPRAFHAGQRFATPWADAATCASGLRVPAAIGDFMILDAIGASGGEAIAVPEGQIVPAMRHSTATEGISICPESAAGVVALQMLIDAGRLRSDDRIVLFNTGSAAKYVEAIKFDLPVIERPSESDATFFRRFAKPRRNGDHVHSDVSVRAE
jgi:threonine synthase